MQIINVIDFNIIKTIEYICTRDWCNISWRVIYLYHSISLHNSPNIWFKANKRSFPATFIFH